MQLLERKDTLYKCWMKMGKRKDKVLAQKLRIMIEKGGRKIESIPGRK